MAIEKIKTAAEVITGFLNTQAQNDDLDPSTLEAVSVLRGDGKLTKTNLLRQLEALRKAATDEAPEKGQAND